MADYYTTPLPTVGVTPGPTWASTVNDILTLIEGHGHTGTDEVQITPAAMNINAPLNFNNNDLSGVNTFTAVTANIGTLNTGPILSSRLPVYTVTGTTNLTEAQSGGWIRANGASPILNLPTQDSGIHYYITFVGTGTLTINATNSAQIVILASATVANGHAASTVLGSTLHLSTPGLTFGWRAISVTGTWTLT